MKWSPKAYYGRQTSAFHADNDFDIGDTYTIPANYSVHGIYHSHGTAHLEYYNGAAWNDVLDKDGNQYPGAGRMSPVDGSPVSAGGTNNGSLRIAGSGVNNSTLVLLMSYTARVAA